MGVVSVVSVLQAHGTRGLATRARMFAGFHHAARLAGFLSWFLAPDQGRRRPLLTCLGAEDALDQPGDSRGGLRELVDVDALGERPPSAWRSCTAMLLAGSLLAAIAEASA
jgi:hypothetical protein